jgi:hypothetical protein
MKKYYKFEIYDNDSYLLEVSKVDRYKYITCSTCNMILNKRCLIESHLPFYRIKRKRYHLSGSYDGFIFVSQSFKDLYEVSGWQGLIFYFIPKSKGFYLIECTEIINVNQTERPIELKNKCNECGQYMGVYGSIPSCINYTEMQKTKSNTFFRSDLEFGYDFGQSYSLFASEEIITILKVNGLIINKDLREIIVIN